MQLCCSLFCYGHIISPYQISEMGLPFLHNQPWISLWIKLIFRTKLDITFYILVWKVSGTIIQGAIDSDIITIRLWHYHHLMVTSSPFMYCHDKLFLPSSECYFCVSLPCCIAPKYQPPEGKIVHHSTPYSAGIIYFASYFSDIGAKQWLL